MLDKDRSDGYKKDDILFSVLLFVVVSINISWLYVGRKNVFTYDYGYERMM